MGGVDTTWLCANYTLDEMYLFLKNRKWNEYIDRDGNTTFLFGCKEAGLWWYVVSFNKHGKCNNAASFDDKREAWRLFCELIHPDLENEDGRGIETQTGRGVPNDSGGRSEQGGEQPCCQDWGGC